MSSFSDEELEREVSNEDQNEYYTLLNVPRDASPEEIRSAYRRLCRIYHPDRYQDESKQETASHFFKRIQEAYHILNDHRLRAVYDLRGRKGVEDDRAIIERTTLPSELMEEYEKLKALFEERTYIQEANPRGLFQVTLNATPVTLGGEGPLSILLKNVYMQQAVDARITNSTNLGLVGSVFASHSGFYYGFHTGFRQQLAKHNWIKTNFITAPFPGIGVDFYRNLTDKMYITSENVFQISPNGFGLSLNAQLARKLDDQTSAILKVKDSGNAVGLAVTRQISDKLNLSGDVLVGYRTSYIQLSAKFKPKEDYILNGSMRLSTKGPSLSYGVDHSITKLTKVGAQVIVSSHTGVQLTLQFTQATMKYVLKIHLSPFLHLPAVLYATITPLVLFGCFKVLALAPILHRQRLQELEDLREERKKEMSERKKEAVAAIELMQETVERIVATEKAKHGLIVLEAWYGCLFSTQTGSDPLSPPKVTDVRIPLQCLVLDSKLVLRESSKSILPGFYDPCIGEKKHLQVLYEFRGCAHEVTIENTDSLVIPRQSHKLSSQT